MGRAAWRRVCAAVILGASAQAVASVVDTLDLYSDTIGATIPCVVVRPDSYEADTAAGRRFPVVYLLHCAGCTHLHWLSPSYANLSAAVEGLDVIAVAPSDGGGMYHWWLDSPKLANSQLASFVTLELKPHIDSTYATYADSANTALTGHSMGGFGAMHLLIEYPHLFSIAAPMKAGLDLTYPSRPSWPSYFSLDQLLGPEPEDSVHWQKVNVLRNAHRLAGRGAHLRIYNGLYDNWFQGENSELNLLLDSLRIPHEYVSLPEGHTVVAPATMREIFEWMDECFARGTLSTDRSQPAARQEGVDTQVTARRHYGIDGRLLVGGRRSCGVCVVVDGCRRATVVSGRAAGLSMGDRDWH